MPYLGRMTTQRDSDDRIALLQGTPDLLILKTLVAGLAMDRGLLARSKANRKMSSLLTMNCVIRRSGVLRASAGSARWGVSENNREARFCILTSNGGEQLMEKPASGSAWCEGRD